MFMVQATISIILCFGLLILVGWEAKSMWMQAKILEEGEEGVAGKNIKGK